MQANVQNTDAIYARERRENRKKNIKDFFHRLAKNKGALVGLILLIILILIAAGADLISPYELVTAQKAADRLQAPSAAHIFGTDAYGRDVFARVIHGSRISLLVGVGSAAFCLIVGGFLGAATAYFGGKFDEILMRVMDMIMAIPATLLALSIVAALGTSMVNLVLAISISYTPRFVRLVRSAVLPQVGMDYVEAAKASGSGNMRIIFKEIIPNAIGPVIVQATLGVGEIIISAAGLSFLGLGIEPPLPEWGKMLSEGKEVIRSSPYLVIFPGLCIMTTVLSLNLLGDGLRDALDPRLVGIQSNAFSYGV